MPCFHLTERPTRVAFLVAGSLVLALAAGPVRAGVYDNPPKVFVDDDGRPTGFWPELTRAIAERRGWTIEWVPGTWSQGLRRLREQRIDVMVDVGITQSRQDRYRFADEAVHVSWSRVYRRPGASIGTIPDLQGQRIGGLEESFNLDGPDGLRELLDEFGIEAEIVPLPSYAAVFQALESGRVDAGVTNRDFGNRIESETRAVRTPIVFQPAELHYAFPRGSPRSAALASAFDESLSALKDDSTSAYHQLLDRWLGRQSKPTVTVIDLPPWAQASLAVLAGFAIVALIALYWLNRRLRRRQEQLLHNRSMLAQSQRLAAIGSWRLDRRTGDLEWSDETYRICGVSRETFTPTTEAFRALVHPDDRELLPGEHELASATSAMQELEFRLVRPDGAERLVQERIEPEVDRHGAITALAGSLQDVTERREAERRNALYRRLLEASQDQFCAIDAEGRYITMTASYARTYGFERDETEGRHLAEFFDAAFLEREVWPRVRRCLAGEELRFEADRVNADQQLRHYLIHYFPLPEADGQVRAVGVSMTDLTAFQRATETLRQQSSLLEIAGRLARFGGFRLDLGTNRVIWSDAVAEIHGKPPGYSPTIEEGLRFFAPEFRPRLARVIRACTEEGQPFQEDVVLINAAGQRLWTRAVGQPVTNDQGQVIAIEGAFQDIDAEQRRVERLNQYRVLVEGCDELFVVFDSEHRYVLVNQAYARWHGRAAESIEGNHLASVLGQDYYETELRARVQQALGGETVTFETLRTRDDGDTRSLLVRYFPVRSPIDGTRQVAGVGTDITDLRRAERDLQRQAHLVEMAGRLATVGGWRLDRDAGHVTWTDVTAAIHGMPPGHAPGLDEAVSYFVGDSRPRIEALVEGCLERGEPYDAELEIVDAAGHRRTVRSLGEPIRDADGRIVGAEGAFQDITEQKRAERERDRLNEELAHILESITDAFLTVDADWNFQYVNAQAGRIMGMDPVDMRGRNAWELFPEGLGTVFEKEFRHAMETRTATSLEEYYPPFGMWLDIRVYPIHDGLALYFHDVTERHRILEQLTEQERSLREHRDELSALLETRQALINALPAHIALLDGEGNVLDVNEQWRHFGAEAGQVPDHGVGWNYLAVCDAATGECAEEAQATASGIRDVLRGERSSFVLEYPCHAPDRAQWFRLMATHVAPAGAGAPGAVVMHVDVTERKVAEQRLNRLAYEDPLTGLPTRNAMTRHIEDRVDRDGWPGTAVLAMLDIEGQRDVNDVYGFETGDELLREVGARIGALLPEGAMVARTGGDEFAVFLPATEDPVPDAYLDRIADAFEHPFLLTEASIEVRARFGYVTFGEEVRPPESLLREAEVALFHTRERMERRWIAYTADLDAASHHRIETTRELRRALAQDELRLHFQPKVELETGRMIEAEALIRWEHPEQGLLSPGRFLAVAEQSQLIGPMGDWALRKACAMLREWQDQGLDIVRVSVNISVVQLIVGDLAATVSDALDAYSVEPSALTLEVTESVFEQESSHLNDQVRRIKALGVRLSLDDFGTGYSSLLYLQRYPFDEVKIDQGFVRAMRESEYSRQIVDTVVRLGRALGAEVVPEGIESAEIRDALLELDCRIGQGFYYSVPLAPEDFRWLLAAPTPLPLTRGNS